MTQKIYLTYQVYFQKEKHSLVSLLDTGSDISCISLSYLAEIFKNNFSSVKARIKDTTMIVQGFGDQKIKIVGTLLLPISFAPDTQIETISFVVIDDSVKTNLPSIIGIATFVQFGLTLKISRRYGRNFPYISKVRPNGTFCVIPSRYLTDYELKTCYSTDIVLKPGQVSLIKVFLNAMTLFKEGQLAITSSPLEYNHNMDKHQIKIHTISVHIQKDDNNQLFTYAKVINDGQQIYNGRINCHLEDGEEFEVLDINQQNINRLQNTSILHEVDIEPSPHFSYSHEIEFEEIEPNQDKQPTCKINIIQSTVFCPEIGSDPTAIDNNTKNGIALSDERQPISLDNPLTKEDHEKFNDPNLTIQLGLRTLTDEQFEPTLSEPQGFELPTHIKTTAADIIKLDDYDEEIRPYIKDIFLDSYPEVVPLFSLDRGDLSTYLGRMKLRLKEGAKLPRNKKIFYQSPSDSSHLRSILAYMEKLKMIARVPTALKDEKTNHFASPCFLLPRKNLDATARLCVDYSYLNKELEPEPIALPTLDSILQDLRDQYFFTSLDISQCYNSLSLDPDSYALTQFSSSAGIYYFLSCPTGCANAPEFLNRVITRAIHYKVVYDENGQIVFEEPHVAKMVSDPEPSTFIYYDDLLLATKYEGNLEESRRKHFAKVKRIVKKLHFHRCKIGVAKCSFFKSRVKYIGWTIMHNKIQVDYQRVKKILEFPMPNTTKAWRQFIGVCQSVNKCLGFDILEFINKLTHLTSDTNTEEVSTTDIEAFETIKKKFASGPIFSNLISPSSKKIIYSDASSSRATGNFCAVLIQIVPPRNPKHNVSDYINMDDKNHVIIHTTGQPCIPVGYAKPDETHAEFMQRFHINNPPENEYLEDKYMGLSESNYHYSLTKCLETLFLINQTTMSLKTLGEKCIKKFRGSMWRLQMLDFAFNHNANFLKEYESQMAQGKLVVTKNFIIFEILAAALYKYFVVIDHTNTGEKVKSFGDAEKPVYYILLYHQPGGEIICRPAYLPKKVIYPIEKHRGSAEFCAWISKKVPDSMKHTHILELELYGLLWALYSFKNYCCYSKPTLCITDAKPLFFVFSKSIQHSAVKIQRYSQKLLRDYANLRLSFTDSQNQLADILTRNHGIEPFNPAQVKMPKRTVSDDLYKHIKPGAEYTLDEWSTFVNNNDHLLENLEPPPLDPDRQLDTQTLAAVNTYSAKICALTVNQVHAPEKSLNNLINMVGPINYLEKFLTPAEIIEKQKLEYPELYTNLLTNLVHQEGNATLFLQDNVILRQCGKKTQILLPETLIKYLMSSCHLKFGHCGTKQLKVQTQNYYHQTLNQRILEFNRQCLACALNNKPTYKHEMGSLPTPSEPFKCVMADYLEHTIPTSSKKKGKQTTLHLLVVTCLHSKYVAVFTMEKLDARSFLKAFGEGIVQHFRPHTLLCDNFRGLVNYVVIKTLAMNDCYIPQVSSLNPYNRGEVEVTIRTLKTLLAKFLTPNTTYNYDYMLFNITMMLNSQIKASTGYSPLEIIYGKFSRLAQGPWPNEYVQPRIHPLCYSQKETIEKQSREKSQICEEIRIESDKDKETRTQKLNKNRPKFTYEKGDILFVLDLSTDRPKLAPKYHPSPFLCVKPKPKSCVVIRMADGQVRCYRNSMFKKFVPFDPYFQDISQELQNVFIKDVSDYNLADIQLIMDFDNFEIPPELFEEQYLDLNDDLFLEEPF